MTEPPLSRFAGQEPKPRPTDTLIVPETQLAYTVIAYLMAAGEIFTVEPSPTQKGAWHLGVFESGRRVVVDSLQGMGY